MPPSPRPHRTDDHHADRFEGVNQPSIGEEVVITGLSGKFPESDNVRAFMKNLYEKVDMVTSDDRRWDIDHPEIPNWIGKTNDMDKFDAQFFGVHYKQAWTMDPLGRMMLENAYGAIIDAGVNPRQLRSTKTGVFMGLSSSEAEKTWFYDRAQINGFGLTGCSRSMLANRVSYWLGATGPSYTIDSACSSTIQALEHAYSAMRNGQCDAAVVGGANFCTHPYVSLHYSRLGVLAQDGKTRSFDKNASGYARAEAITVFYLQKAKDAKRIYAQIVHAKSNCDGFNGKYSYPSMQSHREFFKSFYDEINMSPADVEYIEAFGAGIPDAEKNELEAIDEVFCKNRRQPILVGSVKSNMGHAEAASGGCSITKVCLAYERGELPSNLHYSTPRDDVAGIREGRIRVVAEHTPFNRGYAAVCCNSYTGGNVHVLLKGFSKIKNNLYENDLPRLVTASGRSEPRLLNIYENLQSLPLNMEQIRLLHSIHEAPIPGHVFRSYNILKTRGELTVSLAQSIDYYSGIKRPVWFVYSGMGSQWPGMATDLMQIPIFAAAIERCCKILAPKGIDLIKILTDLDPTIYDNILHSFVGIAAVQIGLTDVLSALGIQPDNIIGHSVGELGCAYADGCFTAEEMILAAYSRGLVSVQTPFIKGSMAAVGIGFQDVKSLCPPEIEIACHNGPDSCTISGPAEEMKIFVDDLMAKGIFAKEVPCSNIAYHSKYIAKAGPVLLKYLQEVIKEPKARSSRWLSTSVPQVEWGLPKAKLSSAEYHTNNLLNAVLFEETSRLIPPNAITIEIAPHGLLQAILRRSLPTDCVNIPLTKRGHKDNVEFILNSIGKLYMNGLDPKVANIYPEVQFPVSVGTPMLSHLVSWEHSEEWYSHQFHRTLRAKSGERNFVMATCDEEYRFLSGNIINDLNRFPASGYLVLVWETLAMMLGTHYTDLSVIFENVHIYGDTLIKNDEIFELRIMVQKVTGNFEINWNESIIADGRIYAEKSSKLQQLQLTQASNNSKDETILSEDDVYNILALKGYSYSGVFRGIKKMDISFNNADVNWANNWIALIDSMIQMKVMKENYEGVSELKAIQKMVINTKIHKKMVQDMFMKGGACLQCGTYEDYDLTRCGGVEIIGMRTSHVPKQIMIAPTALQSYKFVPSINENVVEAHEALNTLVQLVLQNSPQDNINILELVDEGNESMTFAPLLRVIQQQLSYETRQDQVKILQKLISPHDVPIARVEEAKNAVLIIASNLSDKNKVIRQLYGSLAANSFLLAREKAVNDEAIFKDKFHIIGVTKTTNERLILLRKRTMETKNTKYITVKSNSKFSWVELVQFSLQKCEKLVLISECDPMGGLLGFFNSMRREPDGQVLSLVLISDYNAPAFRPDLAFYHDQLAKNMPLNVYQNSKWGTYQYRPLGPSSPVLSERVFLTSQRPQDLSSLTWVEGITSSNNSSVHKKLVQVYYSALTSLDVQKASSRLQEDEDNLIHSNSYGMDFCGRTFTGERVMGLLPTGALSSVVGADVDMLWPVPSHWSMEDAATVPQAYANAFYCLAIQSTLRAGMSVLIHNGADALGQAAISICLAHSCKVFVTVGTQNKKEMLLRIFPGLKECNIGNSKDDSFEAMVMAGTNGNGCDIVLNTLSGNLCRVSMRCVAGNGYFVNLNMEDIAEDNTFGMYFLYLERKYRAASMSNIFKLHNFKLKKTIQQMMTEGINKGYVQPLSRVVFNMEHTTRAFRFMSTGRNMGKVVLKIHDEELRPLVTLSHTLFNAQPYYTCSEEGSYLVVTSDDSGLQLADWLVQRGARNLQLHLQQPKNGYQATMIRSWMLKGVNVQRSLEDLQTEIGCMDTLTNASKMGPVLGVFVTNTFIRRGLFINLTPEDFVKEFGDKAAVLINIDSATRKLCSELREFVVFSNQATRHCGLGCSASRLADSVAERICEERCKLGLPALALQWGVLEELDTRSVGVPENITKSNYSMNSALSSLDQLLKSKVPLASSFACSDLEKRKTNILEAVAEVIGVQDFKDLAEDYTLEQLSTEIMAVRELQVMFERDFHLIYTPQRILKMSITELNRLQSKLNEGTKASASGLDLFFTYIDPEEFNAGDPLVRMPTLLSDGTEPEEDLYAKDTYLIMIPGMEGHKNIFPTVTRRLKMNAFACQLPLEKFNESVQDMATRMTTDIMKKVRPASKFYLFAYSFGVSIALEIASNLESQGYTGFVFCLDGGPEYFKTLLDSHIGHLNEHQLQNEVIKHMIHLISGSSSEALERSLTTSEDWEQKLNITMRHLRRHVKFSFQYTRSLLAMAYARIQQARAYSNTNFKKLKSEIILLKATRNLLNCRMEDDYGLGKYSELPVRIFELDCDHASAPYDLNCANIVNSLIIDMYEFRKVNLCDTYVVQMSV